MAKLVVNSAVCTCTMGSAPCTLIFLPNHKVYGCKQPAANITDHVPFLNVPGFVMCNSIQNPTVAAATAAAGGVLTPAACIPALPSPWTPGAAKTILDKMPALDSDSKLNCAYSGVIKISYAGESLITVN